MASTSGPLGTPASARVILTPEIISITGNTARIKLGDDYWEVSLLEILPDASTKKMDVTTDLAAEVKTAVLRLQADGFFDIKTTKKVVFDTDDKMEIQRIYHSASEVEDVGAMTPVEMTNAKIQTIAPTILRNVGERIKVARDVWTKAHPHEVGGTASPTRTAASTATPKPTIVSPAEQLFKGRPTTSSASVMEAMARQLHTLDPSANPKFAGKSSHTEVLTDLRTGVAKHITDHAATFRTGATFDGLRRELQAAASGTQQIQLSALAAGMKTGGVVGLGASNVFASGNEAIQLINKTIPLTDPEKEKLVKLYVEYIKSSFATPGDTFIEAFKAAYPDYQVAILQEGATAGTLTDLPATCTPRICLFLHRDKTSGAYASYDRGATTGTSTLPDLNATSSLPPPTTITPPAPRPTPSAPDPSVTGHRDVGGSGQCADLSLIDQVKELSRGTTTLTPEIVRSRAAGVIRDASFTRDQGNQQLLLVALRNANAAGALLPTATVTNPTTTIVPLLTKAPLEAGDLDTLRTYYADYLELKDPPTSPTPNPRVWLDTVVFHALVMAPDKTGFPADFQIAVLQDHARDPAQFTVTGQFPGDKPLQKDKCLFIWFDGRGHYHTMVREHAKVTNAIQKLKEQHIEELLAAPTDDQFNLLRLRHPEAYLRLCQRIQEKDHEVWASSDHRWPEPTPDVPRVLDTSYKGRPVENYGEWKLLKYRRVVDTDPQIGETDTAGWQLFLAHYDIDARLLLA